MTQIFFLVVTILCAISMASAQEYFYEVFPSYQGFTLSSKIYISESSYRGKAWESDFSSQQKILEVDLGEEHVETVEKVSFGSHEFSSSPDQKVFLLSGSYDNDKDAFYALYDRVAGEVLQSWKNRFSMPIWSPNSRFVSFVAGVDDVRSNWKVVQYDVVENKYIEVDYLVRDFELIQFQGWNELCECFVYARSPKPETYDPQTGSLLNYFEKVMYFTINDGEWEVTELGLEVINSPSMRYKFEFYSDENGMETRVIDTELNKLVISVPFSVSNQMIWSDDEKTLRVIGRGEIDFSELSYEVQDKKLKTLIYNEKYSLLYSYANDEFIIADTMTLKPLKVFEPFWRKETQ